MSGHSVKGKHERSYMEDLIKGNPSLYCLLEVKVNYLVGYWLKANLLCVK